MLENVVETGECLVSVGGDLHSCRFFPVVNVLANVGPPTQD